MENQYNKAVERSEELLDPRHWQELLEKEYQEFKAALHNWYTHRQQWFEDSSKAIQESLEEFDREHLKSRYRELKAELQLRRRNWKLLQNSFASAIAAT